MAGISSEGSEYQPGDSDENNSDELAWSGSENAGSLPYRQTVKRSASKKRSSGDEEEQWQSGGNSSGSDPATQKPRRTRRRLVRPRGKQRRAAQSSGDEEEEEWHSGENSSDSDAAAPRKPRRTRRRQARPRGKQRREAQSSSEEEAEEQEEEEEQEEAHPNTEDEITAETLLPAHICWSSPDGSSVMCFNLLTLRNIARTVGKGEWRQASAAGACGRRRPSRAVAHDARAVRRGGHTLTLFRSALSQPPHFRSPMEPELREQVVSKCVCVCVKCVCVCVDESEQVVSKSPTHTNCCHALTQALVRCPAEL